MKLYFLRHGIAEEGRPDLSDLDRRLTPEGIAEMKAVGRGLSRLGVRIDRIVTSPARRAAETAAIAAAALGAEESLVEDERLAPGCSLRGLQAIAARFPNEERLMLVGHEPDFSQLIGVLCGGRVDMKKSGVARLEVYEFKPDGADLEWLLPPRATVAAGKS